MGEIIQATVAQAGGGGSMLGVLGMFAAMFAIMWFLMIRPERKKQSEHQSMLGALKKGDEVVLSSGLFGKVHAIEDKVVVLEVAEKTRVRVLKAQVFGPASRVLAPAAVEQKPAAIAAPSADEDKKA